MTDLPSKLGKGAFKRILTYVTGLLLASCVVAFAISEPFQPLRAEPADAPQEAPRAAKPTKKSRRSQKLLADLTLRDFDKSCFRSGCHGEKKSQPWLHGPVTVGACEACHVESIDPLDHTFFLARPKKKLCTHCHPSPKALHSVHKAYSDGDCVGCHNPHGGDNRHFLNSLDDKELCGDCHDVTHHQSGVAGEVGGPFAFIHEPIEKSGCRKCHASHQSSHTGLLLKKERSLCLDCHEETGHEIAGAAFLHKPILEKCSTCHAAHGSDQKALLSEKSDSLCVSCHQEMGTRVKLIADLEGLTGTLKSPIAVPFSNGRVGQGFSLAPSLTLPPPDPGFMAHGALEHERGCLKCHSPHTSSQKGLLTLPVQEGCYSCHSEEIKLTETRVIADIRKQVSESKHVHEPVKEGKCQECHDSHGSIYGDHLVERFSTDFYQPFSTNRYSLCFKCHELELAEAEETEKTRFRHGKQNLHFVHVNREKGRSCGVCHSSHGSEQPSLINSTIPFGPSGWPLSIEFNKTAQGGSCTSACHKVKTYDRTATPEKKKGDDRDRKEKK